MPALVKDLPQILCQVFSGKIDPLNRMGDGVSFVDWNGMRNSVTRVEDNTRCTSRRVKRENTLYAHIEAWNVKNFKHDLGHLLTILLVVDWSFSKKDRMFFWRNSKFRVESMMPNFLHIVPIVNDSALNGVFNSENTSFVLGFITNINLFLIKSNHDARHFWSADDGGEN